MAQNDAELFSYSEAPSLGPCIRLFKLAPGMAFLDPTRSRSPLHCSLFWTPFPLQETVCFKALSYTWGTGGFDSTLFVNGKVFRITKSLELALKYLQHPSESVMFWADQICINLLDDEEKSQQVSLMGAIYQAAEETITWLGHPESDSSLFMLNALDCWIILRKNDFHF